MIRLDNQLVQAPRRPRTSRLKGYLVLAAAVCLQTCLGGIYAWSTFAKLLQQRPWSYSSLQTGLIFGTFLGVFTFSVIWTSPLMERIGPRLLAAASGLLLGLGYLIAGLAGTSYLLWWLGIGVVGGLAVGCGYVCPIATAIRWFPHRKGLVGGVAVAGYGAAAILLSNIARAMLGGGWSLSEVFIAVAVSYGVIATFSGLLMFTPDAGRQPAPLPAGRDQPAELTRRAVLADRRFWWLFAPFFCCALPGATVISHLVKMSESFGVFEQIGLALAVSVLAVGNTAGRIVWGIVYDRLGGRRSIMLSLGTMAGATVALLAVGGNWLGFLAAAWLVGFCYGGNFGIYAPESARLYGVNQVSKAYPLLLVSHGLAALVGPPLAGWSFDLTGSHGPALLACCGVAVAALIGVASRGPRPAGESPAETKSGRR